MTKLTLEVWIAHVEKEDDFGEGFSLVARSQDELLVCLRDWLIGALGAHFETLALTEVEEAFETNGFDITIETQDVEFEIT